MIDYKLEVVHKRTVDCRLVQDERELVTKAYLELLLMNDLLSQSIEEE